MPPNRIVRARGFTLVELLVVVSIIALLLSILLPSLRKARDQAKTLMCQTRARSLSTGAFTYCSEWGVYPPSLSNFADSVSNPSVQILHWAGGVDWLGIGDQAGAFVPGDPFNPQTGNPKGFTAAPKFGALWPYCKDEEVYLCPTDQPGTLIPNSILGGGGNGKFSFSMFSNLGLRPPERIPARLRDSSGGSRGGGAPPTRLSTRAFARIPLFVEEHPVGINDRSAAGHMEGNFNFGTDFVVSRHGPFSKRSGYRPGSAGVSVFDQGITTIGFADGHVEGVKVNFGFRSSDVRPTAAGGNGYSGIPYTAEGLLYYYGIEYDVITIP